MSKSIDHAELRNLVAEMVHVAIEGSTECLIDLTAELARAVGVPYDAVECATCGGFADATTAADMGDGPVCDNCARA